MYVDFKKSTIDSGKFGIATTISSSLCSNSYISSYSRYGLTPGSNLQGLDITKDNVFTLEKHAGIYR